MLNALFDACGNLARVKLVYIAEAHAHDEWPVGHGYVIRQHKSLVERALAAADFRHLYGIRMPVYAAPIDSDFEEHYKPWPFRFFVIRNGKFVLAPKPVGENYDVGELWEFLEGLKET